MKNGKFGFSAKELLSRDEMKNVVGGSGSCGSCNNIGCYRQVGGSTNGQCRCIYSHIACK